MLSASSGPILFTAIPHLFRKACILSLRFVPQPAGISDRQPSLMCFFKLLISLKTSSFSIFTPFISLVFCHFLHQVCKLVNIWDGWGVGMWRLSFPVRFCCVYKYLAKFLNAYAIKCITFRKLEVTLCTAWKRSSFTVTSLLKTLCDFFL